MTRITSLNYALGVKVNIIMTIYRIHPDRMNYQLLSISSDEVISKLGKSYPFHIDPTPKPYSSIWKPLEVSFYDSTLGKKKTKLPDINIDHGRFFLNEAGYNVLSTLIESDGKFYPCLLVSKAVLFSML